MVGSTSVNGSPTLRKALESFGISMGTSITANGVITKDTVRAPILTRTKVTTRASSRVIVSMGTANLWRKLE